MGAVSSSLASCLAAGNADNSAPRALGEAAAGDGLDGDAPTRTRLEHAATVTRLEHAATVIAAYVRRHLEHRLAGKALVGKSVRIAASAESTASVRRYDGCTGTVTRYDISTDCCHVDVGATASSPTLEDLEKRVAELTAMMQTHDIASPKMQLRAQQLLGGLTVPMQLLETVVIPRANVVVIGVVSLAGSRFERSFDGAADGAAVAVDPISEREQLMLLEEIAAELRSEGEFLLGGVRHPDLGPPSGSGVSAPPGPPGDTSSASGSGMPPPPESSSAGSVTGGKRRLASGNNTAVRHWGDLVRTDPMQAAAEIAGLVSVSTAGIGVAASVDDAAMLELFTKKTTATLEYAVGFKPQPALPAAFANKLDGYSVKWLEGGQAKLVGPAVDIFALGRVIYNMLKCFAPAPAASVSFAAVVSRVRPASCWAYEALYCTPPVSYLWPAPFREIVLRCLAADPKNRPSSRELTEQLSKLAPQYVAAPHLL